MSTAIRPTLRVVVEATAELAAKSLADLPALLAGLLRRAVAKSVALAHLRAAPVPRRVRQEAAVWLEQQAP
jgi:hypothetical protein